MTSIPTDCHNSRIRKDDDSTDRSNKRLKTTPTTEEEDTKKQKKPHHELVVVGAGFGGNGVITRLIEKSACDDTNNHLNITIIDQKTKFSIGATYQFTWSSRSASDEDIEADEQPHQWNMKDLKAANVGTLLIDTTVVDINLQSQCIQLQDGKSLHYDTLVLSPGVVSDPTLCKGLSQSNNSAALDICNIQHVLDIKKGLNELMDNVIKEETDNVTKTILICVTKMPYKCPPVPFEVASICDDMRRQRGLQDKIHIKLSVPVAFPFAGPSASKVFVPLCKEQNIEYLPNHIVEEINQNAVRYKVVGEQETTATEIMADLLLCTYPQRAPAFCSKLCNSSGFIPVDLQTNVVLDIDSNSSNNNSNVYAIGDACLAMMPGPKQPHPKSGEFAYMMGIHVADQIVAKLKTNDDPKQQIIEPPVRVASCVAEFGMDGKGVTVQPDMSDPLANPETGMPKFHFPIVENASTSKTKWINKYIDKFFQEGIAKPFAEE